LTTNLKLGLIWTALAVLLLAAAPAAAQERTMMMEMIPSRDSGVSGTVTLAETESGVEVVLEVTGLPEPAAEHPAHIHRDATCIADRADMGGPVEYPLEPVVAGEAGTGTSTTALEDVTLDRLFAGETTRYVNVHAAQEGEEVPPGISCADLIPERAVAGEAGDESAAAGQYGADGVQYAGGETLRETGGMSPAVLLAVLVAAGLGLIATRRLSAGR
jgi:hypothetical protein